MQFDQLKRRNFITLLGGAAAWPLVGRAQQAEKVRWIGALTFRSDSDQTTREATAVFEQSLSKLGWAIGRNIAIDYRWGVNDFEKARLAVAQILRLTPDLILANGGPALTAAQKATRTVPIVFTAVSEPVERGFVASMARPGGNTTGFTNLEATIGGKWLELLKEIAPRTSRVTAMFNPASSFALAFFRSVEAAGQKLGIDVAAAHVTNPAEIDAAVMALAGEPSAGLMLPPDGFTGAYQRQIVDLSARHRLPAVYGGHDWTTAGGLISYGIGIDQWRGAASYVDRILRGENPADLPVQAPTKYELVINLKTAKALGLTVSNQLQLLADEVIE